MADILIPKLGMSMTEGTLTEWFVADGATIGAGDNLYALETDKSVTEVQADVAGTVRIIGETGETFPVGALIGRIE